MSDYLEIVEKLRVPFDVTEVEFRPAEVNGDVLAYVNDKVYLDRLHQAAPGQWFMSELQVHGEGKQTIVSLCITVAGIPMYGISDPKSPTSAFAQALKRATVPHGLGADLYRFPRINSTQVRYSSTGKSILTDNLSIAVWAYDKLGLPVSDEARETLNNVEPSKRFNPKPQEQRQEVHQERQQKREVETPQGDEEPIGNWQRHAGKISEKQCKVLYRAGITDDEITRLGTQDARDVVSALIARTITADQIRSQYLPVQVAAGGKRKSW